MRMRHLWAVALGLAIAWSAGAQSLLETNFDVSTTSVLVLTNHPGRVWALVTLETGPTVWYSYTATATTNGTPLWLQQRLLPRAADLWSGPVSMITTAGTAAIKVQEIYR